MNETITSTIIGAASGAGACVAGQAIVAGVGFTSQGVLAGSIAAGVQSGIGNVVVGSAFAGLQAIGATGAIISMAPVAIVGGGALGLIYVYSWFDYSLIMGETLNLSKNNIMIIIL